MKIRSPKTIYRVGLTGGAASGKSTLAKLLSDAGILVVELDAIGRNVTRGNAALLKQITALGGPDCVVGDDVDRAALRRQAFADPDFRTRLEGILHPAIWAEYNAREASAEASGKKMIVCEAAIFVDHGTDKLFDEMLVVHTADDTRRLRLLTRPGVDPELAERILAAQVSEAERLNAATTVIANDGSEADLVAQAQRLVAKYKKMKLI